MSSINRKNKNISACIILHDIRSVYNVGSIFRTADAAGVEKVYLSGFTPLPVDRFGRKRKDFAKVALGAEETVPWEHAPDIIHLVQKLKKGGCTVIGVEQAPKARDYKKVRTDSPLALVFGNEVIGLSKNILAECDIVAEIPMRGKKESLNVAVAAGIALFRIVDI